MSPLRFLMLTTFYPPHHFGGDAIGLQRLCRGLARRGHEVEIVCDTDAWRSLAPGPWPEIPAEPDGITVHRLRSRVGKLSCLLTQQLGHPVVHGRRIRRLAERGGFDVIGYHNVSLISGPGAYAFGDALKFTMAHEHWLVCPSHVLWRHGRELCTGKQCLRCVLNHRRPPQLWRATGKLERMARRHMDVFIAMSEFSARKHREFGFPFEMEVVPYFLPDEGGTEAVEPVRRERPYLLFVGRLEGIKGLQDVIPVMRAHPGMDLLIAGDGLFRGELERLAAGIENVHFLGRLAPEELPALYAGARALVVPSICYETFGIILIEAFRQGTPVLARRLGPFPEIVEAAEAGELFGDEAELSAAIGRIATDVAARERRAAAGREAFERRWSETAVVPRFLEVLANAARRSGRNALAERLLA